MAYDPNPNGYGETMHRNSTKTVTWAQDRMIDFWAVRYLLVYAFYLKEKKNEKIQDLLRLQGQTDFTVCCQWTTILSHLSSPTDDLRIENVALPHKTVGRSIKTQRNRIYLICIKRVSGFRKMNLMPGVSSGSRQIQPRGEINAKWSRHQTSLDWAHW